MQNPANAATTSDSWDRDPVVFDDVMTNGSASLASERIAAYDFSAVSTVVDVAGGRGMIIASILKANPHLRGVLVDLPHVVSEAQGVI